MSEETPRIDDMIESLVCEIGQHYQFDEDTNVSLLEGALRSTYLKGCAEIAALTREKEAYQSPKFIVMIERKPRSGKRVIFIAKRVDEPLATGDEVVAPQGVLYESFAVYNYVSEAVSRATELNGGG